MEAIEAMATTTTNRIVEVDRTIMVAVATTRATTPSNLTIRIRCKEVAMVVATVVVMILGYQETTQVEVN